MSSIALAQEKKGCHSSETQKCPSHVKISLKTYFPLVVNFSMTCNLDEEGQPCRNITTPWNSSFLLLHHLKRDNTVEMSQHHGTAVSSNSITNSVFSCNNVHMYYWI